MNEKLSQATELRSSGDKQSSRALLLELVAVNPDNADVLYQCAWTHDSLGLEREAVQYYERAIDAGLVGRDLEGAYLGLGSILRSLGEYQKGVNILEKGANAFPASRSLRVFLAMARYNAGRSKEAVSDLLILLIETSGDPEITQYQSAIRSYADDLDRVWSRNKFLNG